MVGETDTRTRNLIPQRRSPQLRDNTPGTRNIDIAPAVKTAVGGIESFEKRKLAARDNADRLIRMDLENQYEEQTIKSQSAVLEADELQVPAVYEKQKKSLSDFSKELEKKTPEHLKREMRIRYQNKTLPFERRSALHHSKEFEKHSDSVFKKRSELDTVNAMLLYGNKQDFDQALSRVEETSREHSISKGTTKEMQDFNADMAKGNSVIAALQNASSIGDFDNAQRVFEDNKDVFKTDEQRIKAQKILKQAERENATTEAINLKNQAQRAFGSNHAASRAFIEQNARNGDVAKEALSFQRNDEVFQEREKKKDEERRTAKASRMIIEEGHGALSRAKAIAPEAATEHLTKLAKQQAEGGLTITEPEVYNSLIQLSREDEELFKNVDLRMNYSTSLSKTDLGNLVKMQEKMFQEVEDRQQKIKFSTVRDVAPIIDRISAARGFSKAGNPEAYATMWSIASDIYEDLVDSKETENIQDKKQIEDMFEKKFRVRSLPVEDTSLFGGFFGQKIDPESPLTQKDIIERVQAGEPAINVDDASEADIELLTNKWKQRNNGIEPTEEQLQKMLNSYARQKVGL